MLAGGRMQQQPLLQPSSSQLMGACYGVFDSRLAKLACPTLHAARTSHRDAPTKKYKHVPRTGQRLMQWRSQICQCVSAARFAEQGGMLCKLANCKNMLSFSTEATGAAQPLQNAGSW
jgi:hypothetical protein